jgi:hypothetical protein
VQAQREKQSDVVVAFPTERARLRAVRALPEIFAPVSAPHRGSTVVPLRCGHAAKRAAVLVKVRRLNAEIQALTNPRGTVNDMKCLPLTSPSTVKAPRPVCRERRLTPHGAGFATLLFPKERPHDRPIALVE